MTAFLLSVHVLAATALLVAVILPRQHRALAMVDRSAVASVADAGVPSPAERLGARPVPPAAGNRVAAARFRRFSVNRPAPGWHPSARSDDRVPR